MPDASPVRLAHLPTPLEPTDRLGAALGLAPAADELPAQADEVAGGPALVVTADGSGGAHAGLAAGLGTFAPVPGWTSAPAGTCPRRSRTWPRRPPTWRAGRRRPAHRAPTATTSGRPTAWPPRAGSEAPGLAARPEGLVLDPAYSRKAMAALVTAARSGVLPDDGAVVFLHAGGLPALFAAGMPEWVRDT